MLSLNYDPRVEPVEMLRALLGGKQQCWRRSAIACVLLSPDSRALASSAVLWAAGYLYLLVPPRPIRHDESGGWRRNRLSNPLKILAALYHGVWRRLHDRMQKERLVWLGDGPFGTGVVEGMPPSDKNPVLNM